MQQLKMSLELHGGGGGGFQWTFCSRKTVLYTRRHTMQTLLNGSVEQVDPLGLQKVGIIDRLP